MNISIEHILLFLIVVFLFYHFLGNCGCVKEINGFSVGGQSASATCKCRDLDTDNTCIGGVKGRADKCTNYNNKKDCLHWQYGNRSVCLWNTSSCRPSKIVDSKPQYNFDLTPLNLDPRNGSIIYEITSPLDSGWTTTSGKKITSDQLSVLNCLQEQLKIRYIGVNKQEKWYKYGNYNILAGVNPGEKSVDLYFYDPTRDYYNLSIDETSVPIHNTKYKSDNPKIIHLKAYS